ncbi:uncharacterized protein LOC134207760 [Armigeres subalbatus]|uniref:uncharacterized protein LOC134207760 n=1 Tax=Armigeres subalbatus TaxID=124917 RepID=UPI002ED58724
MINVEHNVKQNDERTSEDFTLDRLRSGKTREERRPLFDISNEMDHRSQLYRKKGMRYKIMELDSAAYDLMTGGNMNYSFKQANMQLPSIKTLKRHIARNTEDTKEATVMIQPLLNYLHTNQYPLVVALSEDATALSPNPEYDSRTDSLRGLVAPLDEHGIPIKDYFKVRKMITDLTSHHVGEHLYIIMATPMAVGASPICIFYMCSDNRFTCDDVLSRWSFIEAELNKAGITVICNASDGDPRLLKAMKIRSGITKPVFHQLYGPYFNANMNDAPISIEMSDV